MSRCAPAYSGRITACACSTACSTRALRGPLEALVADQVARQISEHKLDALYSYRWHGDRSRLHIPDTAVVNNALFNLSGGTDHHR